MIDKKTILTGGIFLGIGIYILPTFITHIGRGEIFLKVVGALVMAASTVYFIASDVFTGRSKTNKGIKQKLKAGIITPEQAFELESKQLDIDLLRQEQLFKIEQKKAKIKALKQPGGGQDLGSSIQGRAFKMPDVLGNIGGIISPPKAQSPDILGNVGGIVGGDKPKPKKKPKKQRPTGWY